MDDDEKTNGERDEAQRTEAAMAQGAPTPGAGEAQPAAEDDANKTKVRALGVFHKDGNFQGGMSTHGEEFMVDRNRAAELRANGLVEFVDTKEEEEAEKTDPTAKVETIEGHGPGVIPKKRGRTIF